MIGLAVAFFIALGVTWALSLPMARLAVKCGAVAVPRDRDVHDRVMPRWGGVAIYAGVMCAVLVTVTVRHINTDGANGWSWHLVGVLLAATFIGLAGMLDDVRDLSPRWQIAAMTLAGLILIGFGVRIEGIGNPITALAPRANGVPAWIPFSLPVSILVTLFWVMLVTKTVDAVDGLDGLAAGVVAISAGTLALLGATSLHPEGPTVSLVAASVVGACVGFLRHNYNPAKVFMSTVGAQFLGLTMAGISIMGAYKIAAAIAVLVPVLVLGVPIFDYGVVLVRRAVSRAPLTKADRRHLHHHLLDRGLSQRQAVWVIYGCTAVLCLAAVLLLRVGQ